MRKKLVTLLYTIEAFIDDVAYWVIGRGEDEEEREIKTPWGEHYYGGRLEKGD